jgi:hypothetical protein
MAFSKRSGYTTIIGLTQGTADYNFPSDGWSFTANNGDIVVLKVNDAWVLVDYSYIQKKTGTSTLNTNFHESISSSSYYSYIGGSIDGKWILIEVESSTWDISRIVQFSSTSTVYSALPMSTANMIAVWVRFDATHGNTDSIIAWNTSTNSFDTQLDITWNDGIKDMVWKNATEWQVLIGAVWASSVWAINFSNASGHNSIIFSLNLSNLTPNGWYLNLGQTSVNDVNITRLFPTATEESYLYGNGSYSGNGFDANGVALVNDTQSTSW